MTNHKPSINLSFENMGSVVQYIRCHKQILQFFYVILTVDHR